MVSGLDHWSVVPGPDPGIWTVVLIHGRWSLDPDSRSLFCSLWSLTFARGYLIELNKTLGRMSPIIKRDSRSFRVGLQSADILL